MVAHSDHRHKIELAVSYTMLSSFKDNIKIEASWWAKEKQFIKIYEEGDVSPYWIYIGLYETSRGLIYIGGRGYATALVCTEHVSRPVPSAGTKSGR